MSCNLVTVLNPRCGSGVAADRPRYCGSPPGCQGSAPTYWAVLAVLIGVLMFGAPHARAGPAELIESAPRPNEIVHESTVLISLLFDEPVDHESSTLILRGGAGERRLSPNLEAGVKYLTSATGKLTPGDYELVYEAHLANGETLSGTVPFTVR